MFSNFRGGRGQRRAYQSAAPEPEFLSSWPSVSGWHEEGCTQRREQHCPAIAFQSPTLQQTAWTYMVVFETSFMLVKGSEVSGQRKRHGAKTMAKALGDMRLTSSINATLKCHVQNKKTKTFKASFPRIQAVWSNKWHERKPPGHEVHTALQRSVFQFFYTY